MTEHLYRAIFRVAGVLEVPVVIAALAALALVILELGRYLGEVASHRPRGRLARNNSGLTRAAAVARRGLAAGDARGLQSATDALETVSWSRAMAQTSAALLAHAGRPGAENQVAKDLADFDFGRLRRLGVTRLLVRLGPALGLMGTLIPLAPALDGLANGHVSTLTENLRVAFSVTVLGLLVGAVAFGISLARDRLYGQDYSDLEFIASVLLADEADVDPSATEPAAAEPAAKALPAADPSIPSPG